VPAFRDDGGLTAGSGGLRALLSSMPPVGRGVRCRSPRIQGAARLHCGTLHKNPTGKPAYQAASTSFSPIFVLFGNGMQWSWLFCWKFPHHYLPGRLLEANQERNFRSEGNFQAETKKGIFNRDQEYTFQVGDLFLESPVQGA